MQHIKRKAVMQVKLEQEVLNEIPQSSLDPNSLTNLKYKDVKNFNTFQIMENGDVIFSFFYNDNGRACAIPLANPILIYFNQAQSLLQQIHFKKQELLSVFRQEIYLTEAAMKSFYEFFGMTSNFVVMLRTAMEALVNQKIDKDLSYEKNEQNKYLKTYNYEQIVRWLPFEEKVSQVLNIQMGKSFEKNYPLKQTSLQNLKELRDQIIHTKDSPTYEEYINLYKKSLNFKFLDCIESVRDFINFYHPDLVEPCGCGVEG
jgi:hypothetical protein